MGSSRPEPRAHPLRQRHDAARRAHLNQEGIARRASEPATEHPPVAIRRVGPAAHRIAIAAAIGVDLVAVACGFFLSSLFRFTPDRVLTAAASPSGIAMIVLTRARLGRDAERARSVRAADDGVGAGSARPRGQRASPSVDSHAAARVLAERDNSIREPPGDGLVAPGGLAVPSGRTILDRAAGRPQRVSTPLSRRDPRSGRLEACGPVGG